MVLDSIVNAFGSVWTHISDFVILIMVIIYTILFFVIQYYLIKFYIFIIKLVTEIPAIKHYLSDLSFKMFGIKKENNN